MQTQTTQPSPICLPEVTGCSETCCPFCSAPLEFSYSYAERIEEAACPQCSFRWVEPAEQPCGRACEVDAEPIPF